MPVQFEIHENVGDMPSEILDELIDTPRLCMLLNPNLTQRQIQSLVDTFYVVDIKHEGAPHLAAVWNFYPESRDI